jgi:predicted RNA-binding Zn-ribbon protein involved in translation (DUF1610 family)
MSWRRWLFAATLLLGALGASLGAHLVHGSLNAWQWRLWERARAVQLWGTSTERDLGDYLAERTAAWTTAEFSQPWDSVDPRAIDQRLTQVADGVVWAAPASWWPLAVGALFTLVAAMAGSRLGAALGDRRLRRRWEASLWRTPALRQRLRHCRWYATLGSMVGAPAWGVLAWYLTFDRTGHRGWVGDAFDVTFDGWLVFAGATGAAACAATIACWSGVVARHTSDEERRSRRVCSRCGYPIATVPDGQCPECGPPALARSQAPRRRRRAAVTALICVLLGATLLSLVPSRWGPSLGGWTPRGIAWTAWRWATLRGNVYVSPPDRPVLLLRPNSVARIEWEDGTGWLVATEVARQDRGSPRQFGVVVAWAWQAGRASPGERPILRSLLADGAGLDPDRGITRCQFGRGSLLLVFGVTQVGDVGARLLRFKVDGTVRRFSVDDDQTQSDVQRLLDAVIDARTRDAGWSPFAVPQ